MWNLIQNDAKKLIHRTETDVEILKANLWLPKAKCWREGEGQIGKLGLVNTPHHTQNRFVTGTCGTAQGNLLTTLR